jgi:benzylsuccinate CoA-transferase BbsF subunit
VRIADFTWVGAGPYLTKPLADHGADVIKIESQTRIDPIRNMSPFRDGQPGVNRSGYFADRNSSKRSICVDLKASRGRELALRLIAVSDIVTSNFSPGTMDRLGIGYADAQAVRSDVIYLEMPMQGVTGPRSGFRGYGLTIAAASGFMELSGYPDRPPVGTGTNYPDHVPNPLHATVAILAALRARRKTGVGRQIELSQLESTVNVIGPAVLAASDGSRPTRIGNDDPVAAPHGVYQCAGSDRWCAVAVFTDTQWGVLCDVIDRGALATRSDLATAALRLEQRGLVDEILSEAFREREAEELADALASRGVPASPVQDAADLINRDVQLRARDHWVVLDHPVMGPSIYNGIPYRLSATPGHLRAPAPLLGADSRDVCLELLDVSPAEYEQLLSEGIVA